MVHKCTAYLRQIIPRKSEIKTKKEKPESSAKIYIDRDEI